MSKYEKTFQEIAEELDSIPPLEKAKQEKYIEAAKNVQEIDSVHDKERAKQFKVVYEWRVEF